MSFVPLFVVFHFTDTQNRLKDKEIARLKAQVSQLESLCRALQARSDSTESGK